MIEEEPEGGFSACVPDLPGCVSQGETIEEAVSNTQEAIAAYLESLRLDGQARPSSRRVVLTTVSVQAA